MFENPALASLGLSSLADGRIIRPLRGGFLVEDADRFVLRIQENWKALLTRQQQIDLLVAWGLGSTATSNSIVLVHGGMLIGRGFAQPSRVLSCKVAMLHATENNHGVLLPHAVAYSDSFFPFKDGPKVLVDAAGIKVIFATSGSVRDEEVQAFCRDRGVLLLQLPDKEARGFSRH